MKTRSIPCVTGISSKASSSSQAEMSLIVVNICKINMEEAVILIDYYF